MTATVLTHYTCDLCGDQTIKEFGGWKVVKIYPEDSSRDKHVCMGCISKSDFINSPENEPEEG